VCRPGSVIGPQQDFLESIQTRMWDEGHRFRAAHRLPPPLKGSVMAQFAAAQAAAEAEAAAAAASEPAAGSSSSAASSAAAAYVSGSNPSSSSSSRDHSALLLRRKLLVGSSSGSSSSGSLGALREASGLRGSLSGGGAGSAGSSGSTWEQLEREAGASSAALSAALSALYPAGSSRGRGAAAAAAAGGGGGEGASSYARLAGLGGQYAGSAPHRVTAAAGAAALLSTPATAGPGPSSPGREMSQGDLLRLAKEKARSPTGAGRH
jgi:cell division cycle 14